MRKLTLNPETLRVESFAVDAEASALRGTVRAHSYVTIDYEPCGSSDDPSVGCVETDYYWESCGYSCINKCAPISSDSVCAH